MSSWYETSAVYATPRLDSETLSARKTTCEKSDETRLVNGRKLSMNWDLVQRIIFTRAREDGEPANSEGRRIVFRRKKLFQNCYERKSPELFHSLSGSRLKHSGWGNSLNPRCKYLIVSSLLNSRTYFTRNGGATCLWSTAANKIVTDKAVSSFNGIDFNGAIREKLASFSVQMKRQSFPIARVSERPQLDFHHVLFDEECVALHRCTSATLQWSLKGHKTDVNCSPRIYAIFTVVCFTLNMQFIERWLEVSCLRHFIRDLVNQIANSSTTRRDLFCANQVITRADLVALN